MPLSSRVINVKDHVMQVVTFADRREQADAPQVEFMYQTELESLLYGAGVVGTTSAVYRLLRRAGVGGQSLCLRRGSVADGLLSNSEFDELIEMAGGGD